MDLPTLPEDDLCTPKVGPWAIQKYKLLFAYCDMFTKSMHGKWDCLVYLDLFAGAGMSKLKDTGRAVPGSPLIALSVPKQFDRYIFCESDSGKLASLQDRTRRLFPGTDCHFLGSDANLVISEVIGKIPRPSKDFKVLSFCFVDPCKAANLSFETIRAFRDVFVDFLILIPTNMDLNRRQRQLVQEDEPGLDNFFGDAQWRDAWKKAEAKGQDFVRFVMDYYGDLMSRLPVTPRYIKPRLDQTTLVKSDENLRLYRLAFYSRHPIAGKFWRAAQACADEQSAFDFPGV